MPVFSIVFAGHDPDNWGDVRYITKKVKAADVREAIRKAQRLKPNDGRRWSIRSVNGSKIPVIGTKDKSAKEIRKQINKKARRALKAELRKMVLDYEEDYSSYGDLKHRVRKAHYRDVEFVSSGKLWID